jgi:hypothetical protein
MTELLILCQVLWQEMTAIIPNTFRIVCPHRGTGRASDISTNNKFNRKDGTSLADSDVGMRAGDEMIRNKIFGEIKPPIGSHVQNLSL